VKICKIEKEGLEFPMQHSQFPFFHQQTKEHIIYRGVNN